MSGGLLDDDGSPPACSVYECGVLLLVHYVGDCSSRSVVRDHVILLAQDYVGRN